MIYGIYTFFVLFDSLTYWPYGEQRSKSGGINIPFHYIGAYGYYEDTSNRLYGRARYYRADLGNWITKDPLWPEDPAYAYVRGMASIALATVRGRRCSIFRLWLRPMWRSHRRLHRLSRERSRKSAQTKTNTASYSQNPKRSLPTQAP